MIINSQIDFFKPHSTQKKTHLILQNAEIFFYPNFFSSSESDLLFESLNKSIMWRSDKIKIFNKWIDQPRLMAWYGEATKEYTYSGLHLNPLAWIKDLELIKAKIEQETEHYFNSALLNLYRNGQDSVGWHSDDEAELGTNPVIASLSLGQTRVFQLKHKTSKDIKRVDIELEKGSLLIMSGSTQKYWLHQIPKSKKIIKERINITFRKII